MNFISKNPTTRRTILAIIQNLYFTALAKNSLLLFVFVVPCGKTHFMI